MVEKTENISPNQRGEIDKPLRTWQKPEIDILEIAQITLIKGGSATDGPSTLIS